MGELTFEDMDIIFKDLCLWRPMCGCKFEDKLPSKTWHQGWVLDLHGKCWLWKLGSWFFAAKINLYVQVIDLWS